MHCVLRKGLGECSGRGGPREVRGEVKFTFARELLGFPRRSDVILRKVFTHLRHRFFVLSGRMRVEMTRLHQAGPKVLCSAGDSLMEGDYVPLSPNP